MNQSRRDFIKNLAKGASLLAAPVLVGVTTVPGTYLELSHLFGGHHEELTPDEKNTVDVLKDASHKGTLNEDIMEKELSKHPESRKQRVLDAFVGLVIFPKGVLSKFFSDNFGSAALNTFLTIPLYLSFSDSETRKLWAEEFSGAIKGVSMMNTVLQLSEMVQVDVDRIAQRLLTHKRQQGLLTYYADSSVSKKILNGMNIYVDTTKGQKQSVVVNDVEVRITPHMFFLLLPVLSSSISDNTKAASIISIIKKHIHSLDAEQRMEHVVNSNYIRQTDFKKISELSRDVQEYSLNLLQSEIRTLTVLFYATQIPLFGVGQAAAFKKKVGQIAELVYQIAIAGGRPEYDADILKKNILCLVTSYGPNRLAGLSDIGPNTGALQKGGWDGLKIFILEQLPIITASGVSFYKNVERICSHVLPGVDVSSSEEEPIEETLKKSDFLSDLLTNIGEFVSGSRDEVKDIAKHTANFASDGFHFSATVLKDVGERLENSDNKSFALYIDSSSNEALRKHSIRNYTYISDKDINLSSTELDSLFSHIPAVLSNNRDRLPENISVEYACDTGITNIFVFKNILHIAYFIQEHWDAGDNKFSQKIFESNEKHFVNLIDDLDKTHTHPELFSFLKEHFSEEREYKGTLLFDLIYENQILSPEIPGVSDLSFSLQNEKSVQGSISGTAALLAWNIKFLHYGAAEYPEKHAIFLANFHANCTNLLAYYKNIPVNDQVSSLSYILGSVASQIDESSCKYFNTYISPGLRGGEKIVLESVVNIDEESSARKKAASIYDSMADKLRNIYPGQAELRHKFEKGFEGFVHRAEQHLGKNSREVIQMVLLLQSPFVLAVRRSAQRAITSFSDMLKSLDPSKDKALVNAITEMLIGSTTYGLSMFADNYIGLLVGVDLYKDLLGLDPITSIGKVGKFSVYGGSQVVSGNAPNPLLSLGEKWYAIYDTLSEEEKEKLVLNANKIKSTIPASDLAARENFKKVQKRQSAWAHGFDIVFDIFMLTLMNHGAVGKMFGGVLLASRGDTFGNNVMASMFDTISTQVSSAIATLLAPFKMVYDRKK